MRSTRLGEAGCPRSVSVVAPCKRMSAAVRETAMAMVEQAQRTRAAYSILVSRPPPAPPPAGRAAAAAAHWVRTGHPTTLRRPSGSHREALRLTAAAAGVAQGVRGSQHSLRVGCLRSVGEAQMSVESSSGPAAWAHEQRRARAECDACCRCRGSRIYERTRSVALPAGGSTSTRAYPTLTPARARPRTPPRAPQSDTARAAPPPCPATPPPPAAARASSRASARARCSRKKAPC